MDCRRLRSVIQPGNPLRMQGHVYAFAAGAQLKESLKVHEQFGFHQSEVVRKLGMQDDVDTLQFLHGVFFEGLHIR